MELGTTTKHPSKVNTLTKYQTICYNGIKHNNKKNNLKGDD